MDPITPRDAWWIGARVGACLGYMLSGLGLGVFSTIVLHPFLLGFSAILFFAGFIPWICIGSPVTGAQAVRWERERRWEKLEKDLFDHLRETGGFR